MDYGGYVVQMMEVSSLEDFYYYRTKVSHLTRLVNSEEAAGSFFSQSVMEDICGFETLSSVHLVTKYWPQLYYH